MRRKLFANFAKISEKELQKFAKTEKFEIPDSA